MLGFTNLDYVALSFFLIAWLGYHAALELTPAGQRSLNKIMNQYRYRWMEQMVVRENRIVDTTIMASLMNGTAFFASTSLIAVGGVLALLQSTDSVLPVFADLPFGPPPTRLATRPAPPSPPPTTPSSSTSASNPIRLSPRAPLEPRPIKL